VLPNPPAAIVSAADRIPQMNLGTGVLALTPPIATSPVEQTQQIDLNNKLRREKPDESDTKMMRINMIQRGFGPIFHDDQIDNKINQSLSRLDLLHELQNRSLRISKQNQRYWCAPTWDLFPCIFST
jgi:hypothetical protein